MLGCSRYFFGDGANSRFWQNVRPASGEAERHLRNAHYYQMLGRTDVALKELEEAHQVDPHNLKVVNNLARIYEEIGEFDRAQQLYQEALVQDSANPALTNNLCYSYYLAGKWDQAESCFRQALAKDPQNLAARNNLGLLLCRNGRTEEARRLWQEAEGAAAAENKLNQVLAALGQTPANIASGQRRQPAASPPPIAAKAQPSSGIDLAARPAGPLTPTPVTPAPAQSQVAASPAAVPVSPISRAQKLEAPQLAAVTPDPGRPLTPPVTEKMTRPQPASQPLPGKKPVPAASAATGLGMKELSQAPAPAAVKKPSPPAGETAVPAASAEESPPVIRPRAPASLRPQALATRAPVSGERTRHSAAAKPGKAKHPAAQAALAARPPAKVAAKPAAPRVAKASLPTPASGKASQARRQPPLTVEELVGTGIEVLNGNGTPNLARRARLLLSLEGFRVDSIGNWRDFGVDETVIYYRPGALRVAEAVNGKFFQTPQMQENDKLAEGVDVKVVLGHDLTGRADLEQKLAAASRPVKETGAAPATAQIEAWVSLPETPPKPGLTAQELSQTAIEVRNGNGAPEIARQTRTLLSQEGFQVARIGNHLDFGVEKTVIYFRPEAQRVAQALNAKFFHSRRATADAKLPKGIDIKVILGQDLNLPGQMAKLVP
jgi:hypothetical protein